MNKLDSKRLTKIIILLIVVSVLVPICIVWFFIGDEFFWIFGYITLIAVVCFLWLPVIILGSLARAGIPVPLGPYIYAAYNEIKNGLKQYFTGIDKR